MNYDIVATLRHADGSVKERRIVQYVTDTPRYELMRLCDVAAAQVNEIIGPDEYITSDVIELGETIPGVS